MIPDLGVMVGMYIITKMVKAAFDSSQGRGVKVLSWITIVTAVICMIDILNKGSEAGSALHY